MLPRRLEVRFALEALFLVLLALGAGFAGLRPLYIIAVMAGAWLLVALAELTAERIERSPLSYLLPGSPPAEEEEAERIFGPPVEERTVVAPPVREAPLEVEETGEHPASAEPEPAAVEADEAEPAPEAEPEPEPEPEPEAAPPPKPSLAGRLRRRLRRREPELEPTPPVQPRHVKLLPRRAAPEPSKAAQEVAELFGARSGEGDEEPKEAET